MTPGFGNSHESLMKSTRPKTTAPSVEFTWRFFRKEMRQ